MKLLEKNIDEFILKTAAIIQTRMGLARLSGKLSIFINIVQELKLFEKYPEMIKINENVEQ
jgi:hypothetical protein